MVINLECWLTFLPNVSAIWLLLRLGKYSLLSIYFRGHQPFLLGIKFFSYFTLGPSACLSYLLRNLSEGSFAPALPQSMSQSPLGQNVVYNTISHAFQILASLQLCHRFGLESPLYFSGESSPWYLSSTFV